jgi:hypothetical protein
VEPDRIPDGIEPLVGYRMWSVSLEHRHASLHSLTCSEDRPCPWDRAPSAWITATCNLDMGHEAPGEGCACGIYALKSLPDLIASAGMGWLGETVLGRVELAGKIIEHDTGYRAERARVVELIPIEGHIREIMLAANRLGLPLSPAVPGPPPPSQEDLRILQMAADDVHPREIADAMNISSEAVVRRVRQTLSVLAAGSPARTVAPRPTDQRGNERLLAQRWFWWLVSWPVGVIAPHALN